MLVDHADVDAEAALPNLDRSVLTDADVPELARNAGAAHRLGQVGRIVHLFAVEADTGRHVGGQDDDE
ncbi:hypothetical protein [Kitasatospora sp. NPDC059327]|uniref:hypothetical protein n=1 Tax=Kitasatospora sp. NPDC059327 TaxID=3346803 RepID=UPI0036CC8797